MTDTVRLAAEASFLHHLALEVGRVETLADLAKVGAEAAREAAPDRGVHLQLWEDDARGGAHEVALGPEMSSAMAAFPLTSGGQSIGELVVDGEGLEFDARRVLTMISVALGGAAARIQRQRERDEAQEAAILALATLAERRDNETGGHIRRVAAFSRLIAIELRAAGEFSDVLTDDWIADLERSAPLHDVGKVAIPDSILLKPGKLTAAEWEVMKTHTTVGAETIAEVMQSTRTPGFLAMGHEIALCHHERWNGEGYPQGLRGEEIPLCARILALADVYDALTSERPYKRAWSHREALRTIEADAGKHFDARIVAAFLTCASAFDRVRREWADVPAAGELAEAA